MTPTVSVAVLQAKPGLHVVDTLRDNVLVFSDFTDLERLSWVVWSVALKAPRHHVPLEVVENIAGEVSDIAGIHGCVYMGCDDASSVFASGDSYVWRVRIPREQHERRPPCGAPTVVEELHNFLRATIHVGDWQVAADRERSLEFAGQTVLRDSYADFLRAIEVELLGLRHDGAERLDPQIRIDGTAGHGDTRTWLGTYTLWLCADPDAPAEYPMWTGVRAGLIMPARSVSALPAPLDGEGGDVPRLVVPRPDVLTWCAVLATNGQSSGEEALFPDRPAARYQWRAPSGTDLSRRVARDVRVLFPPTSG